MDRLSQPCSTYHHAAWGREAIDESRAWRNSGMLRLCASQLNAIIRTSQGDGAEVARMEVDVRESLNRAEQNYSNICQASPLPEQAGMLAFPRFGYPWPMVGKLTPICMSIFQACFAEQASHTDEDMPPIALRLMTSVSPFVS